MPTQIISVKFFAAALVAASIAKQSRNLQGAAQYYYFAAALDAPVSPSSAPKDGAESSSSSDKMRPVQRQKSRPSKRQTSPQKQQQQQQQQQNQQLDNNEQQIHPQEKQQMKHISQHTAKSEYDAYMHWCEAVLGIRSVVEIREIEYVDHLRILYQENEYEALHNTDPNEFEWLKEYSTTSGSQGTDINKEKSAQTQTELPTKLVRGLVAKHDISVGDIVISIPLYSLLSVPSTIDHDPVLSRILGPKAREKYGWTDTLEYEVPLLVIAVLYHRSLGMESPLSHYIDVLLGTPTDFPFLWSNQELRDNTDKIGEGVKKLAKGIQKDLRDMYDRIMGKLVTEHSDLFSPPNGELEGWMYSYQNFQWAFALVISRHHYLPIQDLDYRNAQSELASEKIKKVVQTTPQHTIETTLSDSTVLEVVPPANQPTDSWVDLAMNEEKVIDDAVVENPAAAAAADDDDIITASGFFKHSFLAPLADMINFGPPCLTGSYNPDEHVFELIATCPFQAGQEVTFYYSSECADVIIANYAFLHPLVPPCATLDEVKEKSEEWKNQAMDAEEKLWKAHRQVDVLIGEVLELESQLQSCESGDDKVIEGQLHSMPYSNERSKTVGDETSSDSETTPSHQKLRKDSSSRNHEVGVRGRMNEPSHEEFDEQIMEELG